MNAYLGEKLSIVTHKAQTTRKRVLGIYTSEDIQIAFYDTPGLLSPKHDLHKAMIENIDSSIKDSDMILLLIDAEKFDGLNDYFGEEILEKIKSVGKPKVVLINKTDNLKDKKVLLPMIDEIAKSGLSEEIIPVSALKKDGLEDALEAIIKRLPESDFLYDPDYLSLQPERFFVSEIIREKIFLLYREEVPYSTEVVISGFKERGGGKWHITAEIVVEKTSQKKIIIGEKGSKIKELGIEARKDIENHLQKKIFLELFVKVRKKWRKNETMLKSFGY